MNYSIVILNWKSWLLLDYMSIVAKILTFIHLFGAEIIQHGVPRFSNKKKFNSDEVIYTVEQAIHDLSYKLTLASTRRS